MSPNYPVVGCVVLTMGRRPDSLRAAVDSLFEQQEVYVNVVIVGNGYDPSGFDGRTKHVYLNENVGIPAGRNAGVDAVHGEYLFFLDDDAYLPAKDTLAQLVKSLQVNKVALVQPRVVDATGKAAPNRWVPRLIAGDHARPGPATSLWEGAVLTKREVFIQIGGWGDPYFYAHEGIELCWRMWDADFVAWYAGEITVFHPAITPTRHSDFWTKNARNRVWLARRNLPWVLIPFYLASWILITTLRARNLGSYKSWWQGFFLGIKTNPGGRRAIRWSTVWRLTQAGRPPFI